MSTRSKWLDWKPENQDGQILEKTPGDEATKTTKTIFDVFVGSPLAISQKTEADPAPGGPAEPPKPESAPTQEQIDAAGRILAQAGVRLVGDVHGVEYVGVWSDLDGPEIRTAITVFHPGGVPVRYLDGDDIPMRYKLRKVPGEPVPANVLAAMEQAPAQPWVVRDRILEEMGWNPEGIPWAEWKAQRLNKLFQEQGATGQPGRITAATVKHGLRGELR